MATDPELRPEGSVAHASTRGASPPENGRARNRHVELTITHRPQRGRAVGVAQ
jgi:hypothetical protein